MGSGERERFGVVVVSVHEQKLEACPAEQSTGGAQEAAPFRVTRQIAEVAEGNERVAALLDGAFDQAAQVASVAVKVAEDEQTAHSSGLPSAQNDHPASRSVKRHELLRHVD